jgi:tetratricopeptide repeat protein
MKSNIEKIDFAILSTKIELDKIEYDLSARLKGAAWRSVQRYTENIIGPLFKVYGSWQIECTRALEAYYREANILPNIGFIHREKFEGYIDKWEAAIEREFNRKHVNMRRIKMLNRLISKHQGYIDSMERFVGNTVGIFDECRRLENIIFDTNTELSTVKFNTITGDIYFTELKTDLIKNLNLESNRYDLLKGGLTYKEINELCRLGFVLPELRSMYISMKTCGEDDFIINLARKDFDNAFSKIPENTVSQMFVAEYILKLSTRDGDSELTRAINAMLKPVEFEDGYGITDGLYTTHAVKYMGMLYTCLEYKLGLNSCIFLDEDIRNRDDYNDLVLRNERLIALTTLFGSAYDVIGEALETKNKSLTSASVPQLSELNINGLSFNNKLKSYDYSIKYSGKMLETTDVGAHFGDAIYAEISVRTNILRESSDVDSQMKIEDLEALNEEKRLLKEKFYADLLAIPLLDAVYIANPALGLAMSSGYELGAGNIGNGLYYGRESVAEYILKDESIAKNSRIKYIGNDLRVKAIQRTISSIVDYIKNDKELDAQIDHKKEEMAAKWFYLGGEYEAGGKRKLVLIGAYDHAKLENIGTMNRIGLEGLLMKYKGIEIPKERKDDVKEEYKDIIYNGNNKEKFIKELKGSSNKGNKGNDDIKDDNDIKASNDIRDNKASNDIKDGNDIRDNKDSNDNKGGKDSNGENKESVIKSIWYGGEDVNVLNMDKAEVEEALQELNSIYYRTTGVELPALDKLLDNIDGNGVDK